MCKDKQQPCECGCRGFSDALSVEPTTKRLVSIRDGWHEYLGIELGIEPREQLFRVYRSPETVRQVLTLLEGLPIRYDHVATNPEIGKITDAQIVELEPGRPDEATIAVSHVAELTDECRELLDSGVRELSLDYEAKVVHTDRGSDGEIAFEQLNIKPDFLALVERGRCGPTCKFADKGKMMSKLKQLIMKFKDAEADITLDQIAEVVAALPEAVRKAPVDKLKELMPALMEIIEIAKGAGVEVPELEPAAPADPVEPVEVKVEDMGEEEKMKMADGKVLFTIKHVQDAAKAAIAEHLEVVEHARKFLPESYEFKGKDSAAIMAAALQAEGHAQKFSDAELPIAFKLLKPRASDYTKFGDVALDDDILALADKEL